MEKKILTTKEDLDALYNSSALTWEGLTTDDESIKQVEEWLTEHKVDISKAVFNIISGKLMNTIYKLKGDNRYPNDLSIVSITGIDTTNVILARFRVGGRWFDDIVDNNKRKN